MHWNPYDLVFGLLLLWALGRAWSRGLLGTTAGYAAPVLAFFLARDWSAPVRDRLAAAMPAGDFLLDVMAPFAVFVVVVGGIRVVAASLAKLLGVGMSVPGRVLASVLGVAASAAVLGSFVVVVHRLRPPVLPASADAATVGASPLERAITGLDDQLAGSALAPLLADFAAVVVDEAVLDEAVVGHQAGGLPATLPEHLPTTDPLQDAARSAARP